MEINVVQGNLLEASTDAIVNPANSGGSMGGGVAGAIKQAGGQVIEDEVKKHVPIPVGSAVITSAGTLAFQGIIHAPTMKHPAEPIPAKQVEQATIAALRAADDAGYESIAFPGMGTGAGDVDVEEAARIMVETIQMYMVDKQLARVDLYAIDEKLYAAFVAHQ